MRSLTFVAAVLVAFALVFGANTGHAEGVQFELPTEIVMVTEDERAGRAEIPFAPTEERGDCGGSSVHYRQTEPFVPEYDGIKEEPIKDLSVCLGERSSLVVSMTGKYNCNTAAGGLWAGEYDHQGRDKHGELSKKITNEYQEWEGYYHCHRETARRNTEGTVLNPVEFFCTSKREGNKSIISCTHEIFQERWGSLKKIGPTRTTKIHIDKDHDMPRILTVVGGNVLKGISHQSFWEYRY